MLTSNNYGEGLACAWAAGAWRSNNIQDVSSRCLYVHNKRIYKIFCKVSGLYATHSFDDRERGRANELQLLSERL